MTVKRFTPRKTPYAEMIALPDGEYVRHEDYEALELHNEYLLARLRKQGEQLDAIGAGGVSRQRVTSQRRGEPVGITSIADMCRILKEHYVEEVRRTDCTIIYTVTFDQLRAIYDRGRREAPQPAEPRADFDDPRVQQVYEIICGDNHPPAGEHWDGYVSRLIVDALFSGEPVGEIRPDDQCDDEVWAEIWADLPPGTKLYAEPAKVPSDAQAQSITDSFRNGVAKVLGLGPEGNRFADTYLLGLISDLVELENEFTVRDERRIAMRETTRHLLYEHKDVFSSHPKKSDLRKHIKELDAENDRLHALLARYGSKS